MKKNGLRKLGGIVLVIACMVIGFFISSHFGGLPELISSLTQKDAERRSRGDMTVRMFRKGEVPEELSEEKSEMDSFFDREISTQRDIASDLAHSLSGKKNESDDDDEMTVELVRRVQK